MTDCLVALYGSGGSIRHRWLCMALCMREQLAVYAGGHAVVKEGSASLWRQVMGLGWEPRCDWLIVVLPDWLIWLDCMVGTLYIYTRKVDPHRKGLPW